MKSWKPAPKSMVIIYFGGFVLLWSGIAVSLLSGHDFAALESVLQFRGAHPYLVPGVVALALHAAIIVLLAWKADRWLFAHGPLAVVFAGVPLIPLSGTCGSCPRSSMSSRRSTSGSRRCTSRGGGCRRHAGPPKKRDAPDGLAYEFCRKF